MNFNFGNLISAAAGAVSSVASAVEGTVSSVASAVEGTVSSAVSAVEGTVSSTASAVDGEISEVASAVSSKLGGIAGAVLGTMSAIASVSEDGNIDDEDMEDMLTEVYKLLVGANIVSFGSDSTSDSDDLSNKAKSLFDEVTGIGRDFIIGTGHSVDRDIFFGVEGINDSDMPNTTSYKVGSAFGDVLSIFAGESEMTVGGGGEVIGVALDGTVVLSPAGVAANVASAGLFVHGGHTMYEGASNLGKDLASFSNDKVGTGQYGDVGGHHVHAKAAFKGDINYDPDKGFSISQDYMKSRGWNHADMTTKQRQLFKELYESGRPNTLEEQTRIAKEALIGGGATEEEADELINESLKNLKEQGVTQPTRIPWYSK
jgi:hypothetical protein